ncbi:MAG: acyl-CoA dehydratase activase [Terriglobia bacterium]
MDVYLGVDVGSVSTNLAVLDRENEILAKVYRRTRGQPIKAVKEGLKELEGDFSRGGYKVRGVGTTGSARYLSAVIVGADVVKNEITAHAVAASAEVPEVKTVLEIGGQDSKIILLRDGVVVDFAMNTVCAAGTGSFLDHQAARLGIPIEEFGAHALKAESGVQIAGRCTVFAESDMIHKQQMGYGKEEIIYGLCESLVRNYINNLGKGKEIQSPVVFQGGVAANQGIRKAFEEALNTEVLIPRQSNIMGAIGAAILAREKMRGGATRFKGLETADIDYETSSFFCQGCANTCEIVKIQVDGRTLACWGGRCGKWETEPVDEETAPV